MGVWNKSVQCFRNRGQFNLSVGVYAMQPSMEVTEEELIFSGTDLIASVGGYLGLYLGASIMSIYHLGLSICQRVKSL